MKSKKEKWLVKSSKYVYKDPWIRLRIDNVVRANGERGNYSVAELKGGIGVVSLTKDNKIVIVGQYRYAPDRYSWEIPKGAFSRFGSTETPLDTAKRELEEETGITTHKWQEITTVHTLLGSTNDKVFLFLATDIKVGKPHPENTESISIRQVSFDTFFEMVNKQEITDATSIAAVALAEKLV
ncbi:MAG: NUDIX hydrolase [Microgenomates group bacterium GW2011_GWC1_41_8]|uniref:NUDIX hydrolase n=3 Tax=Candidatus Roizmaniibacteriota TaxID=1752723 RepID=A0A0G0XBG3_9BACT|nr:MAG: NUDIX hydrolase [Candidatus Roizmanbacteria bacterium GW2011_GWB1_40_7]KKR94141.1 MAG: NUDIX hydrolase [Candidatus Roizmanbacteria bacterium GW2011_GWA1_41_13]KKS21717.1 MAG: NUDIX hydrolase [Candidatus Roizmanbacteria bacterium GW2011_GWC2_41_7]KKS23705.1 MAG: NUDIX hydrolase [Microgenomates group bacterium GW2011_GWC1_41_8]OGK50330.1 MAG: hypothetical protein A3A55_01375 [Candidatus Roizmanbacteria bacterium RIFCSPLOWO2_01_FULL_40_14]